MATKKVVYFTAGINATSGELADIAKLNAAAVPQYEVLVANGAANAEYGETDRIIPARLRLIKGRRHGNYNRC